MKNKIIIIVLCIIFIVGLFAVNGALKKQEKNTKNENIKEDKMSVLEVTSNEFEEEILKSEKPVLVDFYADWCGPCKMLAPIVEQVATENNDVKVCRFSGRIWNYVDSNIGCYQKWKRSKPSSWRFRKR